LIEPPAAPDPEPGFATEAAPPKAGPRGRSGHAREPTLRIIDASRTSTVRDQGRSYTGSQVWRVCM